MNLRTYPILKIPMRGGLIIRAVVWFLPALSFPLVVQGEKPGGPTPIQGLLAHLEYGKPILGIHASLGALVDGPLPAASGTITIHKASLEPSGQGIWKSALSPQLVLEKVRMEGTSREIEQVLSQFLQGWPAGVEIRGLEIRWQTSSENLLFADNVRFERQKMRLENGWLELGGKKGPANHLDLKIFQP